MHWETHRLWSWGRWACQWRARSRWWWWWCFLSRRCCDSDRRYTSACRWSEWRRVWSDPCGWPLWSNRVKKRGERDGGRETDGGENGSGIWTSWLFNNDVSAFTRSSDTHCECVTQQHRARRRERRRRRNSLVVSSFLFLLPLFRFSFSPFCLSSVGY